jgi:hypothetical protein
MNYFGRAMLEILTIALRAIADRSVKRLDNKIDGRQVGFRIMSEQCVTTIHLCARRLKEFMYND